MRSFEYLIQSAFSLTLLLVLTFLPLAPVFANESAASDSETASVDTSETAADTISEESSIEDAPETIDADVETPEVIDSEATDNALVQDDTTITETPIEEELSSTTESELSDVAEEETVQDDADQESAGVPESDSETLPADTETPISDPDNTEVLEAENLEDSSVIEEEVINDTEEGGEDTVEVVEEEDSNDVEETVATSSEELLPTEESVVMVNTVTNDENLYSFSREECTLVGDGSFYCAKVEDAVSAQQADRIFAATDADGDKEIFIERDGQVTAFTSNTVDDDAPYYDEKSDSVVWHRLIDGRYQVVSYNLEDEEESQLTHTSYNNMEPSRYGDVTVWQAWVKNGWEIMVLDDGELTQLTQNDVPDIAPSINKNYIVWQSQENGTWNAKVYDRTTGDIETIEDTKGLSIENARFVLVYDTKHENGDVETRGYDLKTKRSVPLSASPASIPDQLPEPDQTGEERALVQSLIQIKPKTGDDDTLPPEEPLDTDDLLDTATSTSTSTNSEIEDLILPPINEDFVLDDEASSASSTPQVPELVIEPLPETISSSTAHISDVVIPPFESETVDPQEGIASDE